MDEITPQWAWEKAHKLLAEAGGKWGPSAARAFARYIAEHEEPPVDPLLIEAREVCARHFEDSHQGAHGVSYRYGTWDDMDTVQIALAAIKRGIEIGGAK